MVTFPKRNLKDWFLKEPIPFSNKRDLNWSAVRNLALGLVGLIVLVILVMPGAEKDIEFKAEKEAPIVEAQPTESSLSAPASARGYRAAMGTSGSAGPTDSKSRSGSMVVSRDGLDPNSQLHPGTRIRVRLLERGVVSGQALPVIGVVTEDFAQEGAVAIPRGTKVFGDLSFDSDSKRGLLSWRSIQIGTGRVREFDALSTGLDGQAGVEGQVHSDALKNSVGQAMTRFIGAYADGSMERSSFFGSPGGNGNGIKNAVAETAKDQADRMAERMKKEREWIEINPDAEFFALLTQPFRFRDPGGIY